MRESTARSIGWIMKGIEHKPTIVGIIFPNLCLNFAALIAFPVAQQILLIVKPGIATLANSCQITTSPPVTADLVIFPPVFLYVLTDLSYVSAKTYPIAKA